MRRPPRRSTPSGEHRPVLLAEVVELLAPQPGQVVVDCTVGWAGHAAELLSRVGPEGKLIGLDMDAENLPRARERMEGLGLPFGLHHANFAALPTILATDGLDGADLLLADLGMSSMQVDNSERGFSYVRDGPLDMRMDRTRGRTAAQILATMPEAELRQALAELGDEPEAASIAAAIVARRQSQPIERTQELARLLMDLGEPSKATGPWRLHPRPGQWNLHPAARTFQALRMLVNREGANLDQLLRVLPACLKPGGKAALISFHSGEDRRVKAAFRDGLRAGVYLQAADDPIRASFAERQSNPRARSAKLRWAVRAGG